MSRPHKASEVLAFPPDGKGSPWSVLRREMTWSESGSTEKDGTGCVLRQTGQGKRGWERRPEQ